MDIDGRLEPSDPAEERALRDRVALALEESRVILHEIGRVLDEFLDLSDLDATVWLETRAEVGRLFEELNGPSRTISEVLGVGSAKDRLRHHFLEHLGVVISNYELSGVAGTLEWARRVRELAGEEGWEISQGRDAGLRTGEYRLDADQVDQAKADRWRLMNTIRRQPGSGGSRCLALLQAICPDVATKEDLAYVAGIQEWPRRMREMGEAGWAVVSSVDDPTMSPGSYRLETLEKGPPRQREAIARRTEILRRDQWTCQLCGASPMTKPGTHLQIHHKHQVQHGGGNEDENLVTLCVACHAGEHASGPDAFADDLLNPAADPWA